MNQDMKTMLKKIIRLPIMVLDILGAGFIYKLLLIGMFIGVRTDINLAMSANIIWQNWRRKFYIGLLLLILWIVIDFIWFCVAYP